MCVEIDPNDFQFHAKKARSIFNLGKYEEAILVINKSLELSPFDSATIDLKGTLF